MMALRIGAVSSWLLLFALQSQALAITTFESRPNSAVIYRNGYCYCEELLEIADAENTIILLSPQVDIESVTATQSRNRIDGLALKKRIARSQVGDKMLEQLTGYELSFPKTIKKPGQVVLAYGVKGLFWRPIIEISAVDGDSAVLTVKASITSETLDLVNCKIFLASSAGWLGGQMYFPQSRSMSESEYNNKNSLGSDAVYDVGSRTLEGGSTAVVIVMAKEVAYSTKHVWDTADRTRIQRYLVIPNPFDAPISPGETIFIRKGQLAARGEVEWASPRQPLVVYAGQETAIEIERSIVTSMNVDPGKRPPYNHSIALKATNNLDRDALIEVVFEKKLGSQRRADYHFKIEPTRKPGGLFIWDLMVKKGQTSLIDFDFDSDQIRYEEYQKWENSEATY